MPAMMLLVVIRVNTTNIYPLALSAVSRPQRLHSSLVCEAHVYCCHLAVKARHRFKCNKKRNISVNSGSGSGVASSQGGAASLSGTLTVLKNILPEDFASLVNKCSGFALNLESVFRWSVKMDQPYQFWITIIITYSLGLFRNSVQIHCLETICSSEPNYLEGDRPVFNNSIDIFC